ncbi:MAG: sulfite exporter TauE/SafE family protein [Phreatobacter sp.]|uniref:sulfite exporter TauE/SafE family protein n=1 Tax=Phreatobacter sp. TaxID=1966341 RepID=UPI001A40A57E|nr:sulfite exporter TauE/SafE family protein [Phreatobacter sp.]MBL8568021.1 sulfite exporter TauE/SafE family protein [Phreatobacter sp.]
MFILAVASAVFVLAGLVKGVIGLGLPTIAVGMLSLFVTPAQAASWMLVPSLLTNIWQVAAGPNLWPLTKRLGTMLAGIVIGTFAGSGIITGSFAGHAAVALGVVLIVYAGLALSSFRPKVPAAAEPWLSPVIGLATGIVSAGTGIFVMPSVPYLQALGFEKDDLVQALGITFLVATVALGLGLAREGTLQMDTAIFSTWMLLPALAGMWIGQVVRSRISAATFRTCFLVGLIILGAHLALKPLF